MAERHVVHFLRGRKIRTQQPANLFSACVVSNWRIELEIFAAFGHINSQPTRQRCSPRASETVAIFAFRSGRTKPFTRWRIPFPPRLETSNRTALFPVFMSLGFRR